MTIITYALLPITLLWVSYLLHKRGMKRKRGTWDTTPIYPFPTYLLPQEKSTTPTSIGEENE
jgi:hypothetical protein